MRDVWPFALMALLGAYHGLNPAMGWLFAVSLGLQQRSRRAVVRALGPIALGHELSVLVIAGLVLGLGVVADERPLRLGAAAALVAFGLFRFARPRAHPRWTRMQVNGRELTLWSFLMASAHGAGLMVAPVLLAGSSAEDAGAHGHSAATEAAHLEPLSALGATAIHVAAMLAVMAVVAVLVYEKLGVRILRKAWVNTEGLWAGAFVLAGVITLVS